MGAKLRVLTRQFDLAVEGESVEEVGQLVALGKEVAGLKVVTLSPSFTAAQLTNADNAPTTTTSPLDVGTTSMDALAGEGEPDDTSRPAGPVPLGLVTKMQGDTLVLTAKFPPGIEGDERLEDAAMVILAAYGQRGEAPVTGSRLLKSLRSTGIPMDRVDRPLESLRQKGFILVSGARRGRTYGLSVAGDTAARKLAAELAALTPSGGTSP
jgi:hypothetical protein